jgi:hypothetical protein
MMARPARRDETIPPRRRNYIFPQYLRSAGKTGVQSMRSVGPSSVSAAARHTA